MRSSRTIVAVRRPSISGRATFAPTGVTRRSQYDESRGVRTGTSTISSRRPAQPPDLLDHLAVGHDLAAADVEALAEEVLAAARPREVGDDVVERDRLRRRRDPARADHGGQPVDEREDRLERRAPGADDHRRAQRRHRHAAGRERATRLDAAAQMRREVGRVVAEAAEVDDLPEARRRRLARDRLGRGAVAALEVGRSQGVDEVVGDVGAGERRAHRCGVGRIGLRPVDGVLGRPRAARDRHDVVVAREHGNECAPDRAGRSEDDDLHVGSSPIRRRK